MPLMNSFFTNTVHFSVYSFLTKPVRCAGGVKGLKMAEDARRWLSNLITCLFLDHDLSLCQWRSGNSAMGRIMPVMSQSQHR